MATMCISSKASEQASRETAPPRYKLSMIVTAERIAYTGLIGAPRRRGLGSITIYASIGSPFLIRMEGGEWRSTHFAVVPPYRPHDLVSKDKILGSLHVEFESVDAESRQAILSLNNDPEAGAGICEVFAALARGEIRLAATTADIDRAFFGHALIPPVMDRRIARILARMQQTPDDLTSASGYAKFCGLSPSRFIHLFTAEVGISFRRFRAWKRARSFLPFVRGDLNLTEIAMEIGYPDSSHFSHSIRKFYGMRPIEIVAGSRRLDIIRQVESASLGSNHALQ